MDHLKINVFYSISGWQVASDIQCLSLFILYLNGWCPWLKKEDEA